jgi:hypothetical protein
MPRHGFLSFLNLFPPFPSVVWADGRPRDGSEIFKGGFEGALMPITGSRVKGSA